MKNGEVAMTDDEREYKKQMIVLFTGWSAQIFENATDEDIKRWFNERVEARGDG
jgi:hypothetical protein